MYSRVFSCSTFISLVRVFSLEIILLYYCLTFLCVYNYNNTNVIILYITHVTLGLPYFLYV